MEEGEKNRLLLRQAFDFFQRLGWGQDANAFPSAHIEQMRVAGDDDLRAGRNGALQDGVVIRIGSDRLNSSGWR